MKIPLSWIELYSNIHALHAEKWSKLLWHLYSIHTAEIDSIDEYFIDKVVVGKVLTCEKHPESKKLSIVSVDVWLDIPTTILTGAENIVHARFVPVALVWAVLPGDFSITPRKMAGMESLGMICSIDELGLASERAEGIMILEEYWDEKILEESIGTSFFDLKITTPWLHGKRHFTPIRDTVFEIDNKFITNRPDLFSVAGNAREFHAIFNTEFTPYSSFEKICVNTKLPTRIETDKVLSYHLARFENITVQPSPLGIQIMMHKADLTPKMDIVDMTNAIMTELGQPMHAFDADKIAGHIHVRMAKDGETLLALNNETYTLTANDIVIADDNGPVAIAGIIGWLESAVSETTTNIYVESACFDPVYVRLTTQRLWLRTDASTRYEKSLDPLLAEIALPRVIEYMKFLGKKTELTAISNYVQTEKINHTTLVVGYDFINMKAWVNIPQNEVHAILGRLGFEYTKNNETLEITVPSWRATKDVSIKEDIAEEVARIYGYEQVPHIPLNADLAITESNDELNLRNITNNYFSQKNWNEVYNYSFTNETLDRSIGYTDMTTAIGIQNAFNVEYTHMRRSMMPRLLLNVSENLKHAENFSFFEIGKIFKKDEWLFRETKMLAGVCVGKNITEIRSILEWYITLASGDAILQVEQGCSLIHALHPGISGHYTLNNQEIARFGQIHPRLASEFSIPEDTLYFELDYEVLLGFYTDKELLFHSISRFPSIPRDLNFILPKNTPTGHVARILDGLHPWIHNVRVVDTYEDSEKIGEGKKSVTFAFILQNEEATITDTEAMEIQNHIISNMETHGYSLRMV